MANRITRTITYYVYKIGNVKFENGVSTVDNYKEIVTYRRFGARAEKKLLADNGANTVLAVDEMSENRCMSLETFLANSEICDTIPCDD